MKLIANEFVETVCCSKRIEQSNKIIRTFREKIPIIILFDSMFSLPSKRYVLSKSVSSEYLYVLLTGLGNIYIFSQNGTLLTTQTIGKIYYENISEDGFLYLIVSNKLESP